MSDEALVPNPAATVDVKTGQLGIYAGNPLAKMANEFLTSEAHNYNIDDPQEFLEYLKAVSTPPSRVIDGDGKPFNLVFYYCKPVSFTDAKTGEVHDRVLTIMQDDKGNLHSTTAPGIFRTVLTLGLRPGGNRKFNPPYQVQVTKIPSKQPSPVLMLTVLGQGKAGK